MYNSIYGEYATTTHRFALVYYLAITSIWFFKCILKSKRKAELALMIAVSLILRLIFSFDFLVPINQSRTIAPLIEEVYKHIITIIVIKLYSFCTGQGPQVHASDFAVAVGGYMRKGTLLPYQFLRLTFPHALLNYLQFCSFKNSKENFWKNTRKGLILTILVHSVVNFFRSIIVLWLWISIWSNLRIWTNLWFFCLHFLRNILLQIIINILQAILLFVLNFNFLSWTLISIAKFHPQRNIRKKTKL